MFLVTCAAPAVELLQWPDVEHQLRRARLEQRQLPHRRPPRYVPYVTCPALSLKIRSFTTACERSLYIVGKRSSRVARTERTSTARMYAAVDIVIQTISSMAWMDWIRSLLLGETL